MGRMATDIGGTFTDLVFFDDATGSLSTEQLDLLRRHVRAAVRSAIKKGGAHTGTFIPHRRAGDHCPRCGTEVAKATIGGRTTFWCPAEQT